MAVQNQRLQSEQPRDTTTSSTSTPANMPKAPKMPATTTSTAQPQANGGPRVSFNRDVHVKRIGKHPNELTNYETTNLQPPQSPYHQLPSDFSEEDIRKEAALVLAQAERHKSKAENGDNIPTFKVKTKRGGQDTNPKKFHSLPTRKKKGSSKPVERSSSDAAAKKPAKRPSIFSIFSRKSDTNVNQVERDPRFEDSGGRRLVRSKSDVSSSPKERQKQLKKSLKETKSPTGSSVSNKQLPPLSPIIENAQKEDYFEEQFNSERRKSDAITDREKHESGLKELLDRSRSKAEVDGGIIGKHPISNSIKTTILTLQARSNDNMHSSQLPAQKLPLTKGVTVNGLVKRLSMERFSPPPVITSPGFSYIRPNEGLNYAQLELSDDQQNMSTLPRKDQIRTPSRDVRTPVRDFRSPVRDIRSPERDVRTSTLNRHSMDRTDFVTSHNNLKNGYTNGYSKNHGNNSRVILESRESFSPVTGPTTIRISSSHSPSPWQQLSPRNLSDEDEGLGIETRKYYDDDLPKNRSKSPSEPPIIPVIRSITPPRENGYNVHAYRSPPREEPVDNLGYRRARLESRILTRRFGEPVATLERNGYHHTNTSSPERNRDVNEETAAIDTHHRYLSPERELYEPRFHKPETTEILKKYSPERSHLDIISPTSAALVNSVPKTEKTSRYKHTKYYDDGRGGVKEVYERETRTDAQGKPYTRESRHRERLDSYSGKMDHSSAERQQLTDYEPKSLDSQFTSTDQYRSSPENAKHYDKSMERGLSKQQQRMNSEEHWHSSLKRDKLQQRSFDKGDSGIENDFRKESFNGDITTRWRKRTIIDDIRACESFIKKERRHTEQQHISRRTDNYVYRERSIDDGSHFDPHLDKYPVSISTLRRRDQQSQTAQGGQETIKRNKKLGGFEKVKQLFTGGSAHAPSATAKEKSSERQVRATSTASSGSPPKEKDKYMVKEEEMRSRYREVRPLLQSDLLRETKATDISTRRRLSTPKASPLLLKRTSSDKLAKKESPLAKPEKTSWFKSLDRRSKSKSKEKLNVSVNGKTETSSMKRSKTTRTSSVPPVPPKNLRFFGDTDLDSNPPTISRANTTQKTRPTLASTLNRSQQYSQSAYNLDRINGPSKQHPHSDYRHTLSMQNANGNARHKSSSMQNLDNGSTDEVDFRKRRHYSRSRDLDDISESGSETEEQKRPNGGIASARTLSRERLDRTHRYDAHNYRGSSDRDRERQTLSSTPNGGGSAENRRSAHLLGPPKPARSAERRILNSYSRERERFPAESSGTEGESLHSQRSIVYLHATTVGAIPQPYHLRRRSISRDDLRSNKSKNQPIQPMTRTVSRSVSMLAPWKPKLISEGYEINYSQEQNKKMSATMPRKPHTNLNGNSSTLTRPTKKTDTMGGRPRRHDFKDDQSSLRHSSTTSASKSIDARKRIK